MMIHIVHSIRGGMDHCFAGKTKYSIPAFPSGIRTSNPNKGLQLVCIFSELCEIYGLLFS